MKFRLLSLMSVVMVLSIKAYEQQVHEENIKNKVFFLPENYSFFNVKTTENFSSKIDSLVSKIAQFTTLKERQVGFAGETPIEYLTFQELKSTGTQEELNNLLAHYSPVVRVYTFRALKANQMEINPEMKKILHQDEEKLTWLAGCFLRETTVSYLVSKTFLD